jgi:hypothetical protein
MVARFTRTAKPSPEQCPVRPNTARSGAADVVAGLLATAGAPAAHAAQLTSASASAPATSNGQQGQLTGKNGLTYNDAVFGQVKINETQHPKFDTISATFIGHTAADIGKWAGETDTLPWNSDFTHNYATPSGAQLPGSIDQRVDGTLTYTINADGTGYTGQITYP